MAKVTFDLGPLGGFGLRVVLPYLVSVVQGAIESMAHSSPMFLDYPDVSRLRFDLDSSRRVKKPQTIRVTGMFYPGFLLAPGWWERGPESKTSTLRNHDRGGNNSIRAWLYHGFEQWAPSWECSLKPDDQSDNTILGQIGGSDEADSILVIVPATKASSIREEFLSVNSSIMALPADVVGELWNIGELDSSTKQLLNRRLPKGWTSAFKYCLIVRSCNDRHEVTFRKAEETIYSGYLWECLFPNDHILKDESPNTDYAYFLWEHTNFASSDAVRFGIDSLQAKRELLEKRLGSSCTLLQRSAWAVEDMIQEKPFYEAHDFRTAALNILAP